MPVTAKDVFKNYNPDPVFEFDELPEENKKYWENLAIEKNEMNATEVHFTAYNALETTTGGIDVFDIASEYPVSNSFNRIVEQQITDTNGYVCDHWSPAIQILDPTDKKVLFAAEMMVIFKENFPLAEKIKQKLVDRISSICDEVYRESIG